MSDVETPGFDDWLDQIIGAWISRCRGAFRVPPHVAEEVVAEAVARLLADADTGRISLSDRQAVKGYLWRRTYWGAMDYYRQCKRTCLVEDLTELLPPQDSGPEDDYLQQEQNKVLHDVLQALPPQKRLHAGLVAAGLTPQERAEALGMKPGAERTAWHRLRAKLQEMIKESTSGGKEASV